MNVELISKVRSLLGNKYIRNLLLWIIFTIVSSFGASLYFHIIGMDEVPPSDIPSDISSVSWKTYVSQHGQYKIQYPAYWHEPYDQYKGEVKNLFLLTGFAGLYGDARIMVLAHTSNSEEINQFKSLNDWVNFYKESKRNGTSNFLEVKEYNSQLYSGALREYDWDAVKPMHCAEWYTYHINRGYTFRFCFNKEKWSSGVLLMQRMIESIELTNE